MKKRYVGFASPDKRIQRAPPGIRCCRLAVVDMTPSRILAAVAILAATAANADKPEQAQVQYNLEAGSRHIHGASRELDWSMVALADGSFAVDLLIPVESLASNDAEFDAALRKAIESHGRSFIEVHGTARQNRFEGTLRVADFETQISLPVRTERTDGIMTASVTATVDPSKCETLMPGVTKAQLNVTFRVPSSGNAVLAGGSTRFVN